MIYYAPSLIRRLTEHRLATYPNKLHHVGLLGADLEQRHALPTHSCRKFRPVHLGKRFDGGLSHNKG